MEREVAPDSPGKIGPALLLLASLLWLGSLALVSLAGPRFIEAKLRDRLMKEASKAGVELSVDTIVFRWRGPIELRGVRVARAPVTASIGTLRVSWTWQGNRVVDRIKGFEWEALRIELPGEVTVESERAAWILRRLSRTGAELERTGTAERLAFGTQHLDTFRLSAAGLEVSPWLRIRHRGRDFLSKGRFSGVLDVERGEASKKARLLVRAEGMELPDIESEKHRLKPMAPPWFELSLEALARDGSLDLLCLSLHAPGLDLKGRGRVLFEEREVWLEAAVEDASLSLTAILQSTGVEPPEALRSVRDLGVARLSAEIAGAIQRPESWKLGYKLEFDPPAEAIEALARYRGPFVQTVDWPKGEEFRFPVSAGAPTFIPFDDIPPLLVRSLLLAEDSSFFSHPGIDPEAIPVAISLNVTRGGRPRGASTITQQTVKNLFLTKERTLRRKLQELCLALLVEKSLSKKRILEIYLNVIEWGPGIFGLKRASRHYFSKEPKELTPREIAFLVTLIPGPIKYQTAFASGIPSARFSAMIDRLLNKLGSVQALDEEQLAAALSEQLIVGQGSGPPPETLEDGAELEQEGDSAPPGRGAVENRRDPVPPG